MYLVSLALPLVKKKEKKIFEIITQLNAENLQKAVKGLLFWPQTLLKIQCGVRFSFCVSNMDLLTTIDLVRNQRFALMHLGFSYTD